MPCIMGAGEAKGRGKEARSAVRKQRASRETRPPLRPFKPHRSNRFDFFWSH